MKQFSDEVKAFANAIHRLACVHNHTDGCGWMCMERTAGFIGTKMPKGCC